MTDWHEILNARGATWSEDRLQAFPRAAAAADHPRIAPLLGIEALHCTGEGAEKLLQGQLTCDVHALSEQSCSLGACCTPKGRMVANFRLLQRADTYRFHLPAGQGSQLQGALAKYLPFYKCELEEATDWLGLGCWGDSAPVALRAAGLHVPDAINRVAACGSGIVARVHGVVPRFEVWQSAADTADLWDRLQPDCLPETDEGWTLQDIRAGVGWVTPTLSEALVPQMLNLQHLDGISFKKGCYTGQEIVARMQYRGTLKKCTLRFSCPAPDEDIEPGMPIYTALGETATGEVVQSASEGDAVELLAVARLADAEGGTLHLGAPDGPALSRLDLPYSLITD